MGTSPFEIESVGIVGSGTMGRGIAHVVASSGARVILVDPSEAALRSATDQLTAEYAKLIDKGVIDDAEKSRRESTLTISTELGGLSSCQMVIEAVPEIRDLKLSVLAGICDVVESEAIIATNTSSISISRLSSAITDPERFVGLHFFNPAPRMPLVEIIRTLRTSKPVEESVVEFVRDRLKKDPIVVGDQPGFIVNALLVPFLLSAVRMLDGGYATADEIDGGLRLGAGHPMGPLALCDLIGLDVVVDIADAIHAESFDPAFIVPNNLRRMVESGILGRKSHHGFYTY